MDPRADSLLQKTSFQMAELLASLFQFNLLLLSSAHLLKFTSPRCPTFTTLDTVKLMEEAQPFTDHNPQPCVLATACSAPDSTYPVTPSTRFSAFPQAQSPFLLGKLQALEKNPFPPVPFQSPYPQHPQHLSYPTWKSKRVQTWLVEEIQGAFLLLSFA